MDGINKIDNFVGPILFSKKSYRRKVMVDNVNHPQHYQSRSGLETIDIIAAVTEDLSGMEAVCTANVVKYISRWKKRMASKT